MASIHSVASSDPFSDRHAVDPAPTPAAPRPQASRPPSYTLVDESVAAAPAPVAAAPTPVVVPAPAPHPSTPSVAAAPKPLTSPASEAATARVPARKRAAKQGFLRTHTWPGQMLPPKMEPRTAAQKAAAPKGKTLHTRLQEKLLKHTSGVGLAKLGAKVGLLGLAGVGTYFAVTQIIAVVHAGVSAKVGAILLPVGIAVAASLALLVLGYMVVKSFKNMRRDLKAELDLKAASQPSLAQAAI